MGHLLIRSLIPIVLLGALLVGAPGSAATSELPPVEVHAQPTGVTLSWRGTLTPNRSSADQPGWPLIEIGGWLLPAQVVALRISDDRPVAPRIERLAQRLWPGSLRPVDPIIPQSSARQPLPDLAPQVNRELPAAPVLVLREARLRNTRIAVLAVSPIFAQEGVPQVATELFATVPNAALLDPSAPLTLDGPLALADAPGPTNPWAARPSARLRVTQGGIQRLTGADLARAGLDLSTPALIHVRHDGANVAWEGRGLDDGVVDPTDELRFYAPRPGDRWNNDDSYWLTVETLFGRRMATRDVTPQGAPTRSTAREEGLWRSNKLYESTLPGLDGDHWYAVQLRTTLGITATYTIDLPAPLPLAGGMTTLTVTGGAYTAGQHRLSVVSGAETTSAVTWNGSGSWSHAFTLASSPASLTLRSHAGTTNEIILPDSVAWTRPITLSLAGQGAVFLGEAGNWVYQVSGTPAGSTLYDITDPLAPQILDAPPSDPFSFEDGPTPRRYLLSGPGTLHTPTLITRTPTDLATPLDADAIYIVPSELRQAVAPLVSLRQAQGFTVRVIDVQAIYDAWSFGRVAPEAIHAFLRYATATWNPAPQAVTLVGDGTIDPRNYSGKGNANLVPPYLAMVDPWLGETACDTCYARLDGDALPDLLIGRLPVRSAAELSTVVAKIVGYETSAGSGGWRSRSVYIADNYRNADGSIDLAGDFALFADQSIASQPPGLEIRRMYYDPWTGGASSPWRERDPLRAHARTQDELNAGAALLTYVGHANQNQWAVTDYSVPTPYLLRDTEVVSLTNGPRLPVVLEMSCLTAAFQSLSDSATTIDEKLLLHPRGGAVAVWGSTGLGVLHGHNLLHAGFSAELWRTSDRPDRLGALVLAGDRALFAAGGCCQDAISTFTLLGDPLMTVRVEPLRRSYLPLIHR